MSATVTVGRQGRVVIPAEVRAALDLHAGDRLTLRVEKGRVVLERPADAGEGLRALGAGLPEGRSLVEELLAERREAADAE